MGEEDKKFFYIKFKLDEENKFMEEVIVSEDKDTVDEWNGSVKNKKREKIEKENNESNHFKKVSRDFEFSIKKFQVAVPFIMQTTPLMRQIYDDRNIRKFVSRHGEQLSTGKFELYRVNVDQIEAVSRRLEESRAIRSGTNSIPVLFLVGLVSAYDLFLSQLMRCIFFVRPELLSSSERNISFRDLIEMGSIEAARERIIEKEIESVIRNSHHEQIEWLERKLDMQLHKELAIWPEFIEICERRNLLTHVDGVVSSHYLSVCKQNNINIEGVKIGERVRITNKYYDRAVSVMREFGLKLTQVVWRKLIPEEIGEAENEINKIAYRLITERRYTAAITLLRFGLYEMKKHGGDGIRKMLVVNLANAEKLNGNREESERILNREDWTASTDSFLICVAAVRDDIATVARLMKGVVASGQMEVHDFQQWPVFEKIRSNPEFISTFEREFGQKIVADVEASAAPPKLDTKEESGSAQLNNPDTIH